MKSFLARFTDRHPSHSKPTTKESHKSRLVQSDTEAFSSHKPSSSRHDPLPVTLPLPHVERPSLDRRPPSRAGRPLQTPQFPIHELPLPAEDPRASRAGDRPVYHSTRPPASMPTPISNHPIPLPSRAASAKARDAQPPLDLPLRSETHPIPSTPAPKEPAQLRSRRDSVVIPPLPARDVWHPASSSYPRRPEPPPRERHLRHESQDDRRPHADGPELQDQPDRRPKVRNRLVKEGGGERDREERERQKERMRMRDREREREREAEKAREDKIKKDQEEQRKRDEEEQQRRRQLERRERRAKEKEEAEREKEREAAERERQAKERIERERAEKEQQERERAERDRLERERVERMAAERLERERLEKEKLEQEKRERQERVEARERARQERREREKAERERQAKEKAERERQERERQERERERQERERHERERLDRERLERERERERQEKERREKEKAQREQIERERLEKEQRDKEQAEKEHHERERRERERAEKERQEKEQQESEQNERERKERERRERELQEKERREKELQERERQENERREKELQERERRERERQENERREKELQQERERRERELQDRERRERELQERERRERERQEQERQELERQEKERQDRERQEKEKEERLAAERHQLAKALAEKERFAREQAEREKAESERQARELAEKQEKYERDLRAERDQRDKERAEREQRERHEREQLEAAKEKADREQAEEEKRLAREKGDRDEVRYGKHAREGHRDERRHRDSHIDYRDKERPRERARHTTREPDHVEQDKLSSNPPPRNSPQGNLRRRAPEETENLGPEEPPRIASRDLEQQRREQDRDVARQRESDRSRRRQTRIRADPVTDGEHEQPRSRYSTLDRDRKHSGWTSDYQPSSERRHTKSSVVLRPDPAAPRGDFNEGNNLDTHRVFAEGTAQRQRTETKASPYDVKRMQHAPPEIGLVAPPDSPQVSQPAAPSRPRESLLIPPTLPSPPFQPPSPGFRNQDPPSHSPRLPSQVAGIPDSPQGAPPKPTHLPSEHRTKIAPTTSQQLSLPREAGVEQEPVSRTLELSKPSPSPRTQQPRLAETVEGFGSVLKSDSQRAVRKASIDQSPKDVHVIALSASVVDQDRPAAPPKPTRPSPRGSTTLLVDPVNATSPTPLAHTTDRNHPRKDDARHQTAPSWSRQDGAVAPVGDNQIIPLVAPSPVVAYPKPDHPTPVRSMFVPPPQPLPKRSSSTAPQLSFQRPEPVIRPPTSMGHVGADPRISTSVRDMPSTQPITLAMSSSQRLNSNEAFPSSLPVERSSRDHEQSLRANGAIDRPPLAPLPLQDNVRSWGSRPVVPPADPPSKVPESSLGMSSNTKYHQPPTTALSNPHQIWRPPSLSRPPSLNPAIHPGHPAFEAAANPSLSHSRPPSIAAVPSQGFSDTFRTQHSIPPNTVDVAKRYSYINPAPLQFVAPPLPSDPSFAPQDSMTQVRLEHTSAQAMDKISSRNSLFPVPTPQVSTIRLPSLKSKESSSDQPLQAPLEPLGHHRRPSDSMRESSLPPTAPSAVDVPSKVTSSQSNDPGHPGNPQAPVSATSRSYASPPYVQSKRDDSVNIAPTFVPPPLLPRPPSRVSVRMDLPDPVVGNLDHPPRWVSQDFGSHKQESLSQVVDPSLRNNLSEAPQPRPVQPQPTPAPSKDNVQSRDETRKPFVTVPPPPLPRPPSRANHRQHPAPADTPRNGLAQSAFVEDFSSNYRPVAGPTSAQTNPISSTSSTHGPRIPDGYQSPDVAQTLGPPPSAPRHSSSAGVVASLLATEDVPLPKMKAPEGLANVTLLPTPPTAVHSQPHTPAAYKNTVEVPAPFPDTVVEPKSRPSAVLDTGPKLPSDPRPEPEANGVLGPFTYPPALPTHTTLIAPHHSQPDRGPGPDVDSVRITSHPVPPSPISKGSPASHTLLGGGSRTNVDTLPASRPEAESMLRTVPLPPSQNSSRTRLVDPIPEPKASPSVEVSKRLNTFDGHGPSRPVDVTPQVHTPQTQLQVSLPPGAVNQATARVKNSREQIVAPPVAHTAGVYDRRDGTGDTPGSIFPISETVAPLAQPTIRSIQRDFSKLDGRPGPMESTGQEAYPKSSNAQQPRVDPAPEPKVGHRSRNPGALPGEDAEARPMDAIRSPPPFSPAPIHKINHPVLADILFSPAPKPALALSRSTKHDRSPSGPVVEDIGPVDQPDVAHKEFLARRPSENVKPVPVEYVPSNSGRPSKPLNDHHMQPARRPDDVVGGPRRPTESFPPVRPPLAHPTPSRPHIPDSSNALANPRHSQATGTYTPMPGVAHSNPRYSTVPRAVPPRSSQTPIPQPIHPHPPAPPQSAPARQVQFDEDPRRNIAPSRPEPRSTLPPDVRPPSTRPGKGHQPSASLPVTLNSFHAHPKEMGEQPPASRFGPSSGLRPLDPASQPRAPEPTQPQGRPPSLRRAGSEETILMTPSSLNQSIMLKPTTSNQSVTPSVNSQPRTKGGFLGMFRKNSQSQSAPAVDPTPPPAPAPQAPQPRAPAQSSSRAQPPAQPRQHEIWRPKASSKTPDSSPKRQAIQTDTEVDTRRGPMDALASRRNKPLPPPIKVPDDSDKKPFSPFRQLREKRDRGVSMVSMEAQDGASTIIGSPTASLHSQVPIYIPPKRDPVLYAEEWRNVEIEDARRKATREGKPKRVKRPGIVWDLEEDPPEDAERPPPPRRLRRRSTSRQQQRGEQS